MKELWKLEHTIIIWTARSHLYKNQILEHSNYNSYTEYIVGYKVEIEVLQAI